MNLEVLETVTYTDNGLKMFSEEIFVYDQKLMSIFFKNIGDLTNLIQFKSLAEIVGISGADALDIFDFQPEWLAFITQGEELVEGEDGRIALSDIQRRAGKFLANLLSSEVSFTEVPMALAYELLELGLSQEELGNVLRDLIDGPLLDSPDSEPPSDEEAVASADLQTLSFLLNHQFSGTIDPNLIVSAEVAMASSFFKQCMDTFDALSMLGESMDEYIPDSESDIYDPNSDGSVDLSGQDEQPYDGETAYAPSEDDGPQAVLGGKKLSFGAGTYDLSQLAYDRLLISASEHLSVSGSLTFTVNDAADIRNELIFLSAGGLNIDKGSSIRYEGESLGFGSFHL